MPSLNSCIFFINLINHGNFSPNKCYNMDLTNFIKAKTKKWYED